MSLRRECDVVNEIEEGVIMSLQKCDKVEESVMMSSRECDEVEESV
jgi:hypothetical protein